MSATINRDIRIKTGVVNRLAKELKAYRHEFENQQGRIRKMEQAMPEFDEHDIRKQIEVLDETRMMIPDTQSRLRNSIEDLSIYIDTKVDFNASTEKDSALLDIVKLANQTIADANEALTVSE